MSDWFDELSTIHQDFVTASKRMKGNLDALLENNYADPTHFVYELLQNAEDQGATCVEFIIDVDQLTFVHNGDPFRRQDVDSITNIAYSTKSSESNKIGCFGIGFKSVFDVTNRPRIYSTLEGEPFAFAIEDKLVPIRLSCPTSMLKPKETRFIFPFKPKQEADIYQKIQKKLRELGPETLLFLDRLEEIRWRGTLEEGAYLCERADTESGNVSLVWEQGKRGDSKVTQQAHFLRYSKTSNFKRDESDLKVSIAFRIEAGHIVPEQGLSVLHVFFPTREKTNLKFLLHAPMLLTASRDNIKDTKENEQLLQTCARLLAESLPRLRNAGYLDTDCLNCLPIRAADFPEGSFFRPMYQAVKDALGGKEPLLPTAANSSRRHVTKQYGKIPDNTTRGLLKEPQLIDLHSSNLANPVCWLEEKIREQTTADLWNYLQKEVGVASIDFEDFASMVQTDFFTRQDDVWINQFYTALLDARSLWDKGRPNPRLRKKAIIRLEDGTQVVPFDEVGRPNAYFPTGGHSKVNTIRLDIYHNEKSREFLTLLGLSAPAATDEVIRVILPAYTQSPPPVYERQEYALQLQTIAAAINTCPTAEVAELRKCLLATPFLLAYNFVSGELTWSDPVDGIYSHSKELEIWFEGNEDAYFLKDAVLNNPAWPTILKFLNTRERHSWQQEDTGYLPDKLCFRARTSGAHDALELPSARASYQMTADGFDPNGVIDGLDFALQNINHEKAQILWRLLVKNTHLVQGPIFKATRKDYSNATRSLEWSDVGNLCRQASWLPSKGGDFRLPSKIMLVELHPSFDTTSAEAEILSRQLGMKQIVKSVQEAEAEKLGLTLSVLEYIKKHPEQIAEFVRSTQMPKHTPQFPPDDRVHYSDSRGNKMRIEGRNSPEVEREVRGRIVRCSAGPYKLEAKVYLQASYMDDAGNMFCQICEQSMPFSLNDGTPYFEMVQFVKGLRRETMRHYLALCPTCAAKYLYANDNTSEALHHTATSADLNAGILRISMRLANKDCTIRFHKTHLGDLQNTLIGMAVPIDEDDTE